MNVTCPWSREKVQSLSAFIVDDAADNVIAPTKNLGGVRVASCEQNDVFGAALQKISIAQNLRKEENVFPTWFRCPLC